MGHIEIVIINVSSPYFPGGFLVGVLRKVQFWPIKRVFNEEVQFS